MRNLLANRRTSGFVSLRRDKHLLKKYTLPRRSLCGAGSFRFALIYLRPCITLHPPTVNRQFQAQLFQAGKFDKITFSKIKFFTLKNRGHSCFLIHYGMSVYFKIKLLQKNAFFSCIMIKECLYYILNTSGAGNRGMGNFPVLRKVRTAQSREPL